MNTAGQSLANQPLFDSKAERDILGFLLKNGGLLPEKIAAMLEPKDFTVKKHQLIYEEVLQLYDRREQISRDAIVQRLEIFGLLELAGDEKYLDELASEITEGIDLVTSAKTVQQCSLRRKLIYVGENILRGSNTAENPEFVLADAQNTLSKIAHQLFSRKATRLSVIAERNEDILEQQYARGTMLTGLPTGYQRLNALTLGYQKEDLVVIGGLPGMGKTAFALNLATYLATKEAYTVAFFSLESSAEQIGFRLQCMEAGVNLLRLREGRLSRDDKKGIFYATQRMRDAKIYINDTPSLTAAEIYAYALQIKKQHGLDLLIVDHLGLVRARGNDRTISNRNGTVSEGLKRTASELKIPVVALSQLHRPRGTTSKREPKLSDLQGGGCVEQDADMVIFLHRPEYHDPETDEKNVCQIIVAKQRNGPTGSLSLGWSAETTRFFDLIYN